jgi:hypothetical protein
MTSWLLLFGVGLVVLLLYLLYSTNIRQEKELTLADGNVWLPAGHYYTGMLTDAELVLRPLIDVAMPLPTFRTLVDGTLQVVNLYNYDYQQPMGGKSLSLVNRGGQIAVGALLEAMLASSLTPEGSEAPPTRIVRWRKTASYPIIQPLR